MESINVRIVRRLRSFTYGQSAWIRSAGVALVTIDTAVAPNVSNTGGYSSCAHASRASDFWIVDRPGFGGTAHCQVAKPTRKANDISVLAKRRLPRFVLR